MAGFSSISFHSGPAKQHIPFGENDFPLRTRWGSGLVRSKGMETNANLFSSCIYLSNVQKRSVTRHGILIGSCSGKSLLIMAFRHNPSYNYVGSISSCILKAKNPTKLITANPSPSSPPFESRCVTPSAFLSSRQHPCGVVQGSIWRSFLERSGKSGFGGLEAKRAIFLLIRNTSSDNV